MKPFLSSSLKICTSVLRSRPFVNTCAIAGVMSLALLIPFLLTTFAAPLLPGSPLVVRRSMVVPVPEVSAFGTRATREAATIPTLVALGDKAPVLAEIEATGSQLKVLPVRDLSASLGVQIPACVGNATTACRKMYEELTAQWEAAAFDSAGRLWALQENTRTIHIFSKDLDSVTTHVTLNFEKRTGSSEILEIDKRGKGKVEGIAILPRGHVLVAHQSTPAALVEFGPRGEAPLGWSAPPELADGVLPEPQLVPLAAWTLPGTLANCSLNEIAHDGSSLFVLSSSCKTIAVIENLPPGKREATVTRTLQVPAGIMKPEALAVLWPGHYLVGDDAALPGTPNVHELAEESVLVSMDASHPEKRREF